MRITYDAIQIINHNIISNITFSQWKLYNLLRGPENKPAPTPEINVKTYLCFLHLQIGSAQQRHTHTHPIQQKMPPLGLTFAHAFLLLFCFQQKRSNSFCYFPRTCWCRNPAVFRLVSCIALKKKMVVTYDYSLTCWRQVFLLPPQRLMTQVLSFLLLGKQR